MAGENVLTLDQAVKILTEELNYPPERAHHFVGRFDKNEDGKLSATEFNAFKDTIRQTKGQLGVKFEECDRDRNGYVTLDEAKQILMKPPFCFPGSKVLALLTAFDRDNNNKLDPEEFAGFYAEATAFNEDISREFDRLDKDKNGVLSPEEVSGALQEMMCFDTQHMSVASLIKSFDTNEDGNLDKTEFMQLWSNMFGGKK